MAGGSLTARATGLLQVQESTAREGEIEEGELGFRIPCIASRRSSVPYMTIFVRIPRP